MFEKTPQMQNRVRYILCHLKLGCFAPHRQVFTEDEGDTLTSRGTQCWTPKQTLKSFLDVSSLNNHVSLAHQPRSFEANHFSSDKMTKSNSDKRLKKVSAPFK